VDDSKSWRLFQRLVEDAHDELIRPVWPDTPTKRDLAMKLRALSEGIDRWMKLRGWRKMAELDQRFVERLRIALAEAVARTYEETGPESQKMMEWFLGTESALREYGRRRGWV